MLPPGSSIFGSERPTKQILPFRDKQHLVNLLAIDGLYAARSAVEEALTPIPDGSRLILDLGENKRVSPLYCYALCPITI